jgi:diketogulonate reductase-like aldo/keto reductase
LDSIRDAISYHWTQGEDVFPIPGTRHVKYLEENVAAFSVKLSPEELAEIDAAFPQDDVAGTRYPEAVMGGLTYHYGDKVDGHAGS